jgi:hypothetical protein
LSKEDDENKKKLKFYERRAPQITKDEKPNGEEIIVKQVTEKLRKKEMQNLEQQVSKREEDLEKLKIKFSALVKKGKNDGKYIDEFKKKVVGLEKKLEETQSKPEILKFESSNKLISFEKLIIKCEHIVGILHQLLKENEIKEEAGDTLNNTISRLTEIIYSALQRENSDDIEIILKDFKKQFTSVDKSRIKMVVQYLAKKENNKWIELSEKISDLSTQILS